MCTILILRHVHPEWPLILAANRDELYARPSTRARRLAEPPGFVAGLDQVRGGTWMGVTDAGFFVGLTNQRGSPPLRPAPRSRGEVVMNALRAGSVEAVERYLDTLDPGAFNAFNLLYGDARVLRVAYARPASDRIAREDVPSGIHVLPNDVLDAPTLPKVERARVLAAESARHPWPELAKALQDILADHVLPSPERIPESPPDASFSRELARQYQALCIHTPSYGTRSSALLALAPGRVAHFLVSDLPPCQQAFQELTSSGLPGHGEPAPQVWGKVPRGVTPGPA